MKLRAIEIALVGVYKAASEMPDVTVQTSNVVKICNTIMAVIPMSESQITDLLGDLNSLGAVHTSLGGSVQLSASGKQVVESRGLLTSWSAFEFWLLKHPPQG